MFKTQVCKNGCDANNKKCLVCEGYCENSVYFRPIVSAGKCSYEPIKCERGCNTEATECKPPIPKCENHCEDNKEMTGGSYDEVREQCVYEYTDECLYGCDDAGKECKPMPPEQEQNKTNNTVATEENKSTQKEEVVAPPAQEEKPKTDIAPKGLCPLAALGILACAGFALLKKE